MNVIVESKKKNQIAIDFVDSSDYDNFLALFDFEESSCSIIVLKNINKDVEEGEEYELVLTEEDKDAITVVDDSFIIGYEIDCFQIKHDILKDIE